MKGIIRLMRYRLSLRDSKAGISSRKYRGTLTMACSTCLYIPEVGTTLNGVSRPTSVINQENAPQTCVQVTMVETTSQLRFPFPW